MKISSAAKEQTRLRLLESAVEVVTEKGFDRTVYGLFKIFERIGAKVQMRAQWESHWLGWARR